MQGQGPGSELDKLRDRQGSGSQRVPTFGGPGCLDGCAIMAAAIGTLVVLGALLLFPA